MFKRFKLFLIDSIRLRDKHQPCISCGKPLEGKYDAGHFFQQQNNRSRFNEDNVHGQCVHCKPTFTR